MGLRLFAPSVRLRFYGGCARVCSLEFAPSPARKTTSIHGSRGLGRSHHRHAMRRLGVQRVYLRATVFDQQGTLMWRCSGVGRPNEGALGGSGVVCNHLAHIVYPIQA